MQIRFISRNICVKFVDAVPVSGLYKWYSTAMEGEKFIRTNYDYRQIVKKMESDLNI